MRSLFRVDHVNASYPNIGKLSIGELLYALAQDLGPNPPVYKV